MKCWNCSFEQPESFADLVKYWRQSKSTREAGEASGVSAATISRLERGELPDMRTFVTLVTAIGVSPEFAFGLIRAQIAKATDAAVIAGTGDKTFDSPRTEEQRT